MASWERISSAFRWSLKNVPGINFFFDAFFDDTPDPSSVKELLNLISVVDSLLLSAVFAMITCVTYDEMTSADFRWTNSTASPDYYYELWSSKSNSLFQSEKFTPSVQLSRFTIQSSTFFMMSLLAAVMAYIDVLGKDFTPVTFTSWWWWGKWIVILAFVFMIAGVWYVILSYAALAYIKFPETSCINDYSYASSDISCVYGYTFYFGIILNSITYTMLLVFLGLATRAHYKLHDVFYDPTDFGNSRGDDEFKTCLEFVEEALMNAESNSQLRELVISRARKLIACNRVTLPQLKEVFASESGRHEALKQLGLDLLGHRLSVLHFYEKQMNE